MGYSPGSGNHGGMCRSSVSRPIAVASAFTSAYDNSGNGATSPGRWHGAQFSKTIGATCSLNVTRPGTSPDVSPPQAEAPARQKAPNTARDDAMALSALAMRVR